MSEFIKGNMGFVKKSIIEGMIVKNSDVYAICKEKEILIGSYVNKEEAVKFLNECIGTIEKDSEKQKEENKFLMTLTALISDLNKVNEQRYFTNNKNKKDFCTNDYCRFVIK